MVSGDSVRGGVEAEQSLFAWRRVNCEENFFTLFSCGVNLRFLSGV